MANLGPLEIGLIIGAIMLLFGYKKLPDAARALGRSAHILKSEVQAEGKPKDWLDPAPRG